MKSLKGAWRSGFRVFLVGPYLHSVSLLPGVMVTLRSRAKSEQATPTHEGKMGMEPEVSVTKILRWSIECSLLSSRSFHTGGEWSPPVAVTIAADSASNQEAKSQGRDQDGLLLE